MKLFFSILLLYSLLFSYVDDDFDGVDDAKDRCLNTPFSELVDNDGCTISSLAPQYNFDMIIGVNYSDLDDKTLKSSEKISTLFQLDYYYKNFAVELSTSYFMTLEDANSEKGFNDLYISLSYKIESGTAFLMRFGLGVLLPTYKTTLYDNRMDYLSFSYLSYSIKSLNLFSNLSYTFMNDREKLSDMKFIKELHYRDTFSLSVGIGYYFGDALYVSGAYNRSDSIYKSVQDIESLSLYGYYEIDEAYFSTLSYAYGLSESASKNYLSLRFGYLF